ncbi:hypothetical protein ACN38_g4931 [Penicillium nordicum]|uniref:Uncharacterized protein n=1 Tax=Penicillium nordicum TaxID=229535 RepID=A0A0M9WGU1_9EURO|nr:hypothetical protein ACN38_g4931 [Penicillium nordicum]
MKQEMSQKQKETSPGRLELPTSRLTVGRANRLRHGDLRWRNHWMWISCTKAKSLDIETIKISIVFSTSTSPWRNRLARPTVNREVGSSSLPGDVSFCFCFLCMVWVTYLRYLHSFPPYFSFFLVL